MGTTKVRALPLVPLFKNSTGGTTAALCRCGRGGVIALSGAWAVSNEGIGRDDNLILALNALNHRDPTRKLSVTFDEYHHGYGAYAGIMSLIGTPARLGLAQIAMAFVLLVFAVSRRFGRPIPLREGGRPRNEYLSSMSALLRRAHAIEVVRLELERKFMEDMASALGLRPTDEPERFLEAVASRRPDKVQELRRLLTEAPTVPQSGAREASLLTLEARRHQIRKELKRVR